MKFEKETLDLSEGLQKEWIITNGNGGYASSTIIGANTRRYHGLFVAPLNPPAKRFLILSKLDESIQIKEKTYDLFTNIGKEYISQGYKYLESFSKEILPVFKYKVQGVSISKTICMIYRRNTVLVFYKIKNGKEKAKLKLAPIINLRDFHSLNENHEFKLMQKVNKNRIKIVVDNQNSTPIYMGITEGKYIEHHNDIYRNMFYIEEEKRGFPSEENHVVTGRFEINLEPEEEKEIAFMCSLEDIVEDIDARYIINSEIIRQNKLYNQSGLIDNNKTKKTKKELEQDELKRTFLTAIDNFVVYRPTFALHTVIGGYHWFLDYARDTLISFEGLLLKTKRFEQAQKVLFTITRDIKEGLVPNSYSELDNSPIYDSVDSSLLLFEQIQKYVDYTGDYDFVKRAMYPKLKEIIESFSKGIDLDNNNIYLDEDGLIYSGNEDKPNTWMNARYGDFVATPRYGKVVEVNAMWYNALMVMIHLTKKIGGISKRIECKKYEKMAKLCKESFEKEFYNEKTKCLNDYIGNSEIRPNQLFALSLAYPILDTTSDMAYKIIETVETKLLNSYGIKTLAKGEENYVDIYDGDIFKREMSYHQGPTWTWLLGLYHDALMNMMLLEEDIEKKQELQKKIEKFKEKTYKTFKKEINERGCIGSIAELYDSKSPYEPKGAIAKATSVAEIFRIIF